MLDIRGFVSVIGKQHAVVSTRDRECLRSIVGQVHVVVSILFRLQEVDCGTDPEVRNMSVVMKTGSKAAVEVPGFNQNNLTLTFDRQLIAHRRSSEDITGGKRHRSFDEDDTPASQSFRRHGIKPQLYGP
jgi:hypothetical protein